MLLIALQQMRELLTVFGALRSFNFVRGTEFGANKSFALCEYNDYSKTDLVNYKTVHFILKWIF